MPVIPFQDNHPNIVAPGFIAPDAWVIGKVAIAEDVSIFFHAVLRGDIQSIRVGRGTNIQEHALLHTSHDMPDCVVGEYVTVGHRAIIHGATIEDNCIVGMGATILDKAVVQKNCIIGAQSLVTMNTVIPEGSLAMGVPAKVVRKLTPQEIDSISHSAQGYIKTGRQYALQGLSA